MEETNQTLKETLSKQILETDCSRVDLFLTALLRLRITPQSHGSSLYKTVYGRAPPIIKQVSTNLLQVRGDEISQQMEEPGKVINQVTKFVQERVPVLPRGTDSRICARGSGVVKHWKQGCLAPHWKGPCTVVLASPTAVKVAGVTPWVHMRVKRAYHADPEDTERTTQKDPMIPMKPR